VSGATPAGGRGGSAYRPALDGVRALAILGVLLYHADISWLTGGILGVDVFFVLSGYLITSLLVREWDRWGSLDIVGFYLRRARRLLPALCLVVVSVGVWAAFVPTSDRLGSIRADAISTLLYVANWRFVFSQQSYFDQFADPSPFRHMWSLAIEEQYYLLFPLLLVLLLTLARGRSRLLVVGGALGALAVASATEMALMYTPGADPSRVYYGTDTRFFELMIGSVLAIVMQRAPARRPRTAIVAGPLALVAIAAFMHQTHDQDPFLFRGGLVLLCLATAVLLWSVERHDSSPAARLLALAPLVWLGRISYGLYLWHWPVYVAISPAHTSLETGPRLVAVRIGVSVALATMSYLLVEHPIRTGALRRMRPPLGRLLAGFALPMALVVTLVGTAGATEPPLPDSPFGVSVGQGPHRLLVVGDSVGLSLADYFPADSYPDWRIESAGKLGCGLAVQQLAFDGEEGGRNPACADQVRAWGEKAAAFRPEAVLMVIGAWEVFDHVVGGKVLAVGSTAYADYLASALENARRELTPGGTKLYLTNVPCFRQASVAPGGFDLAPDRNSPRRAAAVNRVIDDFAAAHPGQVQVLDLASHLCPGGQYVAELDDTVMRPDGVHFSRDSAPIVWKWLMRWIMSAKRSSSTTTVMTVGDSVPLGLWERFPGADYPDVAVTDSTQLGCSLLPVASVVEGAPLPLPTTCDRWAAKLDRAVGKAEPDVGVVYAGIGEQFDKRVDGTTLTFGTPVWRSWLHGQLTHVVDLFTRRGIPVVMPTVPCHAVPDYGTSGVPPLINDDRRIATLNDVVREVAAGYPARKVTVVDLHARLCADGYTNTLHGVTLRSDGLHFTDEGAAVVWKILMPAIHRAVRGRH
jgi:peptidoglycan/LPS O-acetylase OafA/YrhL